MEIAGYQERKKTKLECMLLNGGPTRPARVRPHSHDRSWTSIDCARPPCSSLRYSSLKRSLGILALDLLVQRSDLVLAESLTSLANRRSPFEHSPLGLRQRSHAMACSLLSAMQAFPTVDHVLSSSSYIRPAPYLSLLVLALALDQPSSLICRRSARSCQNHPRPRLK